MPNYFVKFIKIIGIFLFFVLLLYLYGSLCFSSCFCFRTSVNGRSVFLKTPQEVSVERMMETRRQCFVLKTKSGIEERIPFFSLGITRQSDKDIASVSLRKWTWPVSLFVSENYELQDDWIYEPSKMRTSLNSLLCVNDPNARKATDVYVDTRDGNYIFVNENDGTEVDIDKLFALMAEKIEDGIFFIDLDAEQCYRPSSVSDSRYDQKTLYSDASFIKDCQICLLLDSDVTEAVSEDILSEMLYEKDGCCFIHWNMLYSYVQAIGKKYNTVGMTRMFRCHDGVVKAIKPRSHDSYVGYRLNEYELALRLADAIAEGGTHTVRVPWYSKGMCLGDSETDIGETYFELDIKEQRLWLYVNGTVIEETSVVTGKDVKGRRTKRGLYQVMNLYEHYRMYYDDGNSESEFFIKISPDGIGIHDAPWRSEFGGDIYKKDGSHGCINVPYESEVLFFHAVDDLSNKKIPVIVY